MLRSALVRAAVIGLLLALPAPTPADELRFDPDTPRTEAPRRPVTWSQFEAARTEAGALKSPADVPAFLYGRLGLLPWRIVPDARTPFDPAVLIQGVEHRTARKPGGSSVGYYAYGIALDGAALGSEVVYPVGPILERYAEHAPPAGLDRPSCAYRYCGGEPRW